jgi:hypothetical protein
MKKITTNRQIIIESVTKMVADKNAVRLFLKGKSTIEILKEKGITLAKPL